MKTFIFLNLLLLSINYSQLKVEIQDSKYFSNTNKVSYESNNDRKSILNPKNDKPCNADTLKNGIQIIGNNCMADKEINSPCNMGTDASVWYIIPIEETGKFLTIEFMNMSMSGNYVVDFYTGSDCNILALIPESISNPKCNQAQFDITLNCIDQGNNVYIRVGSETNTCGNYELRFMEENFTCNALIECNDLTPIYIPVNNQVCQSGCNYGICGDSHCTFGGNATYYAFRADPKLNSSFVVSVINASFTPLISISNSCLSEFSPCSVSAITDPIPIPSDGIIYVRVEALEGKFLDKDFQVCVNAFSSGVADCYSSSIELFRTENPTLPSNGPFFPGEVINICYNVKFNVSRAGTVPPDGNNCQWLQGIVPVLYDAWDLKSNPFSLQASPGGAKWLEEGIVHYNFDSPQYTPFTFDDGRLGLKWGEGGLKAGGAMPAGWYWASPAALRLECNGEISIDSLCIDGTNPDTAWGLPGACGSTQNVIICFEAKIKEYQNYQDCENAKADLTMFSFSDGELGCWTNISCALSNELHLSMKLDCSKVDSTVSVFDLNPSEFEISPNPSSERFSIQSSQIIDNEITYRIQNVSGQIVSQGILSSKITTISTTDWMTGLYFVQLFDKRKNIYSNKWVKL